MSRDFQELDYRETPLGELTLRRRRLKSLGDLEIFEVKLGDAFLMSSLFHDVEVALADLGLGELDVAPPWDVVVGGLGLGYTATAALQHSDLGSLLVVDALEPVIQWHRRGLVPLGANLTGDERCRLVHADFFDLANSPDGFDPERAARRFHAVLLDIDHSPRDLLHARHASFYGPIGLRMLRSQLQPRGIFAMWSDESPDEPFMDDLARVFDDVRSHVVTFQNPLLESQSASTVYVARNGG
ncbi:MAG: spermidine synthase [Verrucomicrobiota bacterium]|nr:spermidine synthase [Verrucomicrobiota bacterium]